MAHHGGKRQGAGRKAGAATARTRDIAEKASSEGITPLEVMLHAMRDAYENNLFRDAANFAKDAAPYMHPRLSSVEQSGPGGVPLTAPTLIINPVPVSPDVPAQD